MVACDKTQRNNYSTSEVVEVWKKLKKETLKVCIASKSYMVSRNQIEKAVEERYRMAMTPSHFLASITDQRFKGDSGTRRDREGYKF